MILKPSLFLTLFAVLIATVAAQTAPTASPTATPSPSASDLSTPSGLSGALKSFPDELIIVDVRSENAFSQGHLPQAVNIPLGFLWYQHPSRNLDSFIVVYGQPASADSRKAAEILRLQGYHHVINFGSISKWNGPLQR